MTRTWARRFWLGGMFLGIAALVLGGLGWATFAALRLEREQYRAAAEAEHAEKIRLALWRLDGRVSPTLAREDSRPFGHYSPLSPPVGAIRNDGQWWEAGMVWVPSPLLNAEVPGWMKLHFQVDATNGWQSPQVVPEDLANILNGANSTSLLRNQRSEHASRLGYLKDDFTCEEFVSRLDLGPPDKPVAQFSSVPSTSTYYPHPQEATPNQGWSRGGQAQAPDLREEFNRRSQLQKRSFDEGKQSYQNTTNNYLGVNGNGLVPSLPRLFTTTRPVEIHLGPMVPRWVEAESEFSPIRLVLVRRARVDMVSTYQGVLLDWDELKEVLTTEVADLFPAATLLPVRSTEEPDDIDRMMSALPVRLEPGPLPEQPPLGWTPLRVGLAAAWVAAIVALLAVGFAGRSLMALSDRRMRFASAVTHELRTPLTTLRLYLDMLTSGMVRDEARRDEYLATLNAETSRLHRLIGNVLDFSRLEGDRPNVQPAPVAVPPMLERVRETWKSTCSAAGKELTLESVVPDDVTLLTDAAVLEQLIGTLIDNAQKHTRQAGDTRIWLRAVESGRSRIAIEVEDRGPGIGREKGRIFRAFRRCKSNEDHTGGVGLGLALAKRWARALGAKLTVRTPAGGVGACFRLEMPVSRG